MAVLQEIEALGNRYGLTTIEHSPDHLHLLIKVADRPLGELLAPDKRVSKLLGGLTDVSFLVDARLRGLLKQARSHQMKS